VMGSSLLVAAPIILLPYTGEGLEADLVFLVDSSASVGADNFYNEIKFIRKLLADFTVSMNTTRVVVITYSSVNQAR
jgi:von Willebrand factor type A domain